MFVVSTILPPGFPLIFGYLTRIANGNKGFFKFRLRPDDINAIKGSLGSLEKLVGVDLDSEEFITDSPLIFSLSKYCHDVLYAILTVGIPRFFR